MRIYCFSISREKMRISFEKIRIYKNTILFNNENVNLV